MIVRPVREGVSYILTISVTCRILKNEYNLLGLVAWLELASFDGAELVDTLMLPLDC